MAARTSVKLALIQLAVSSRKADNLKNAQQKIAEAAKQGARLVVLPECFNCPYGTQYFKEYAEPIPGNSSDMLRTTAMEHGIYLIGGSIPESYSNGGKDDVYNTCTVFDPLGNMIAKHRKVHLFDISIPGGITFKESEVLSAGGSLNTFVTDRDAGDLKVGLGICYDVRFPEMAQIYQKQGCRLLLYPGAFNKTTGPMHWQILMQARAVDNQVFVAGCAPAFDKDATYASHGHSIAVDPWGKILAHADDTEQILYADLDLTAPEKMRQQIPVQSQKRHHLYSVNAIGD